MLYATVQEFELTFGEQETAALSDLEDPGAVSADVNVIENALQLASSEIDGYLRAAGYSLPLSAPIDILKGFCLDIARYKLDVNLAREDVRLRYKAAIDFFKGLVNGMTQLPISQDDDGPGSATETRPRSFSTRPTVFTFDSLWDY